MDPPRILRALSRVPGDGGLISLTYPSRIQKLEVRADEARLRGASAAAGGK